VSTTEIPDAETVVGQYWPLHGPYSDDRTRAAGSTLYELIRYLNYATGQGASNALPWANSVESVVSSLSSVAALMDQTLRQLAQRCQAITSDPKLYDYTARDDHDTAVTRAEDAAAAVTEALRFAAGLHATLQGAASHLNYLGHQED
jgi:hypothetical protein